MSDVYTYKDMEILVESYPEKVKRFTTPSKYHRKIGDKFVDVYDILCLWEVRNPAIQHAIKKLLMPGERGTKDCRTDILEAMQSLNRALDLEEDYGNIVGD